MNWKVNYSSQSKADLDSVYEYIAFTLFSPEAARRKVKTDLSALSIYLVDKKQLSNAQSKAADVTGDGVVDLSDLAHLRSFLSKKVDWLGNASNILA